MPRGRQPTSGTCRMPCRSRQAACMSQRRRRLDDVIRRRHHGGAGDGAWAAAVQPRPPARDGRAPVLAAGRAYELTRRLPCLAGSSCLLQRYGRDHAVTTVRDAAIAAEVLAAHRRLSSDDKLQMYKYLQQATHGDCDVEQPSWFNASCTHLVRPGRGWPRRPPINVLRDTRLSPPLQPTPNGTRGTASAASPGRKPRGSTLVRAVYLPSGQSRSR